MVSDEMRLVIADLFKIAHRRFCYPDAMQFEAEMFADSVLEAITPAIRSPALEEAAKIAEQERRLCTGTPGKSSIQRMRECREYERKQIAAAIRAAKEVK